MDVQAPILTLTPNPSVDETWRLEDFDEGRINRVTGVRRDPGGKGVNVARLLRALGADAAAAGFAGGENGRLLREMLQAEGIDDRMTGIAGETRRNLTLEVGCGGRTIKINHPGPEILPEEYRRMALRLETEAVAGSYLAVCGSLPPGMEAGETTGLLARLSARGVRICTDCEALDLTQLARIRPFLVKLNQTEFQMLLPRAESVPADRAGLASAAEECARRTGAIWVVTLGEEGAIAATPEGSRRFQPGVETTAVSSVGAGDAMLGGMLAVFACRIVPHHGGGEDGTDGDGGTLETALRAGVAAGAAKASVTGTGMPARDAVLSCLDKSVRPMTV